MNAIQSALCQTGKGVFQWLQNHIHLTMTLCLLWEFWCPLLTISSSLTSMWALPCNTVTVVSWPPVCTDTCSGYTPVLQSWHVQVAVGTSGPCHGIWSAPPSSPSPCQSPSPACSTSLSRRMTGSGTGVESHIGSLLHRMGCKQPLHL